MEHPPCVFHMFSWGNHGFSTSLLAYPSFSQDTAVQLLLGRFHQEKMQTPRVSEMLHYVTMAFFIIDCGILNPQTGVLQPIVGQELLQDATGVNRYLIGHYHILQHVFNMLPLFSQFLPPISGTNHWVDNFFDRRGAEIDRWKGHAYFRGNSYCQNLKVNLMVKLVALVEFP